MSFRHLEFRLSTVLLVGNISTPITVVTEEFVGWDAVSIVAERNPDYHGFTFNYSDGKVQLSFRCDSGLNLLTTQYQIYGNDAVVKFLLVDVLPNGTEVLRYGGKIDFTDIKINPGEVKANIIEDGIVEVINARWDSPISMATDRTLDNSPITPPKSIEIGLPGQSITESGSFKRTGPFYETTKIESPAYVGFYTLYPNLVNPDGKLNQPTGSVDPITKQLLPAPPELQSLNTSSGQINIPNGGTVTGTGDELPFITCTTAGSYSLKVDWTYKIEIIAYKRTLQILNAQYNLWELRPLLVIVRPGRPVEFIPIAPKQSGSGQRTTTGLLTVDAHYNGNFEVTQGTRVYVYTQIRAFIDCRQINFNVQTINIKVELSRTTRAVDSKGYAFMLPDALKHVFGVVSNALTGGTGSIGGSLISKSSINQPLDGYGTEYAVSSGYQLRNLNTKSPTFTLKQLIGTLSAQHAAGILYETDANGNHSARVEAGQWFYRGGQIMVLDEVDNDPAIFTYSEQPNKDLLINQIVVGYDKFPETGPGVLAEFNTTRTYQTPIITNQLTKEIKCPLIAAGSAIEEARRLGVPEIDVNGKVVDKSTEGGTYDDDAFLLHVAPKSFSGTIIFTVVALLGFPYKNGAAAAKYFQLPDDAEPLKVGDIITFSGTGSPNDNVPFTVGYVSTNADGKLVYTVSNLLPLIGVGTVLGNWTLVNQPVRIRTNERLDVYGVTEPATTYNLELSPARMLRRWAWLLNSGFRYKKATDELRCTDYKNNRDMSSRVKPGFVLPGDLDRQVINETGNIALGEFERFDKVFSPEVITTQVYMSPEQVDELLLANRNLHDDEDKNMGYLTIKNPDGDLTDGFLMKLSYNPTSEVADLVLWKKFADNTPGGVDCTHYADWILGRFETDLSADPNLYRFCRIRDFN